MATLSVAETTISNEKQPPVRLGGGGSHERSQAEEGEGEGGLECVLVGKY